MKINLNKKTIFTNKKICGFTLSDVGERSWSTNYYTDLEIGKTYLLGTEEALLAGVTARPSFRVEKFLFFWTKVSPTLSLDVTIRLKIGNSPTFNSFTTIPLETFFKKLTNFDLYHASLKQKVEECPTKEKEKNQ